MTPYKYFELRGKSDQLIYSFDRKINERGQIYYKRRDQDLRITYDKEIGWCAFGATGLEMCGIPWGSKKKTKKKTILQNESGGVENETNRMFMISCIQSLKRSLDCNNS